MVFEKGVVAGRERKVFPEGGRNVSGVYVGESPRR